MLCLYPDWVRITHKTSVQVTSNKSLFPQFLKNNIYYFSQYQLITMIISLHRMKKM